MVRSLASLISPSGARARLSILIFHRVLETHDPLFPDLPTGQEFERMMEWIRRWFNVLPLAEAASRLTSGSLPSRPLCITFDDGYADNATVATPILAKLGLTGTFFVCPGFLEGGRMWNDDVIESLRVCRAESIDLQRFGLREMPLRTPEQKRNAIEAILRRIKHLPYVERARQVKEIVASVGGNAGPDLMMTHEQLRKTHAAGMTIGGHTATHPILTRLESGLAYREIAAGKEQLEGIIGTSVDVFAYPNGVPAQDYTAEHVNMARRCGFRCAVSTAWGAASRRTDVFQLPRFTPWSRQRTRFALQLLSNLAKRHVVTV